MENSVPEVKAMVHPSSTFSSSFLNDGYSDYVLAIQVTSVYLQRVAHNHRGYQVLGHLRNISSRQHESQHC